jgi:hypothetical protein
MSTLLVECLATFRPTEHLTGLVLVRIEPLPQESARQWEFDVSSTSQIIKYKTSFSRIIFCRTFCPPGPNINAEDPMTDQAEIWKRHPWPWIAAPGIYRFIQPSIVFPWGE